jgi:transcriptional regulator of aromatic amino acid metabolism
MKQVCIFCKTNTVDDNDRSFERVVTGMTCDSCVRNFHTASGAATLKKLVDAIDAPLLVMQGEPRQVFTANKKALELFSKELDQVEDHRGGQVFNCIHAFSKAGCGKDINCQPCRIKNAIVETLTTDRQCNDISAVLDIKRDAGTNPYVLQISTKKIGSMALVRIHKYGPV